MEVIQVYIKFKSDAKYFRKCLSEEKGNMICIMLVSQLCMRKSSISGIPWVPRGVPRHSFGFPQSPWEDPREPQGSSTSGEPVLWPRVFTTPGGGRTLACFVCQEYSEGVRFNGKNKIAKGTLPIQRGKSFQKRSLIGHVKNGKGDHAKCVKNYIRAQVEGGALENREARCAEQVTNVELLNQFAWLLLAVVLPASCIACGLILNMAQKTGAKVLQNQYQGDYFFKQGLDSLSRVIAKKVALILKKAKRVAWHMDIGGGIPTSYEWLLNGIPNWL
jgi:hypothetical protein